MSDKAPDMLLHWSPSAPFVRKVLICAIELDLINRIETVRTPVAPVRANERLLAGENPLSKLPALRLADGTALYDSRVICEYLDCLAGSDRVIPLDPARRWTALRRQALGDGVSDIVILWRDEAMRGDNASARHVDTMRAKFLASLDQMERDAAASTGGFDIGDIATGCALSYLDFRVTEIDWRTGRSALSGWYEEFLARPSAAATPLSSDKKI